LKKSVDSAGSMSMTTATISSPAVATAVVESEGGAGPVMPDSRREINFGETKSKAMRKSMSASGKSIVSSGDQKGRQRRPCTTQKSFTVSGGKSIDRDFRKAVEEHLNAATAGATSNKTYTNSRNTNSSRHAVVGKGELSLTAGNSIGLDMSEFDKKGLLAASFCAPKFGTQSRQTKMQNTFTPGPGSYTPVTTSSFTFTRDEKAKIELHGKNTNAPGSDKSQRKSNRKVKSTFGVSERLDFYDSMVAAGIASDSTASPASYTPSPSMTSVFGTQTENTKLGYSRKVAASASKGCRFNLSAKSMPQLPAMKAV